MIDEVINLIASVLFLAASIGALGIVGLWALPEMYSRWKAIKHGVDTESELYEGVVNALEEAEGRPVKIMIAEEGEDA